MNAYILLDALLLCLLSSSIGFKKTVWFISIGYTVSILVLSIIIALFWNNNHQFWNYAQLSGLAIWAARLGYFLLIRERNTHYNAAVTGQTDSSQQQPIYIKLAIWLGVSVLYVSMFFPALLTTNSSSKTPLNFTIWAGLIILFLGVLIEAIADYQKSAFKAKFPSKFCDTGLYSWVRCPNYLGEIMVWTGNFVIGTTIYNHWWHWTIALVGLICIVLIMIGSTKRLEAKQAANYGYLPEYQQYIKQVPVLFPWIPVYSLKNVKVYLE